jgi:hypothetical protein
VPNLAKAFLALWLLLCGAAQGKSMHPAGPPPGNFFARPAEAIRENPPQARIRITIIVWTAWKCASDCTYCHNDPINRVDVLGAAQVMLSTPEPLPEEQLHAALWWIHDKRGDIFSGRNALIFKRPYAGFKGAKPAAFDSVVGMHVREFLVEAGIEKEQASKLARLYLPFAHAHWEELEVRERWARKESIEMMAKIDADPLVRANRVVDDFRTAFWHGSGANSIFVMLGGSHYTPWIEDPGLAWQEATLGERVWATVESFAYVTPLAQGGRLGRLGKISHHPHVPHNLVSARTGSGSRLIHLTDEAGESGILASNSLNGRHGIFAVPAEVATESTALKVLRTGLTPDKTTNFVRIPDAATSLFSRPVPIGPYSAWKYFGGVRYAPAGSLNMTSGALSTSSSLIGPRTLIYGPDALFYGGAAAIGGTYYYSTQE